MSDYFSALMRSSGMAIGGPAQASGLPRVLEATAAEPGVELSAPLLSPLTVQIAVEPQQAVAPVPTARTYEQAVVQPTSAQPASTPHARSVAEAQLPAAEPASSPSDAQPALGEALVRAAMKWVATDPQQADSATLGPAPRSGSPRVAAEGSIPGSPAPAIQRDKVEWGVPDAAPEQAPAPPQPAAPAAGRTQALPLRPPYASPAVPSGPIAGALRDEVVEISIGAIHVRVDAPAAQTVARSPALQPAPARAVPATANPRSALSRRALRRI